MICGCSRGASYLPSRKINLAIRLSSRLHQWPRDRDDRAGVISALHGCARAERRRTYARARVSKFLPRVPSQLAEKGIQPPRHSRRVHRPRRIQKARDERRYLSHSPLAWVSRRRRRRGRERTGGRPVGYSISDGRMDRACCTTGWRWCHPNVARGVLPGVA